MLKTIPIFRKYLKDKFILEINKRLTKKAFCGYGYVYYNEIETSDNEGRLYSVSMRIEIIPLIKVD